MSKRILLPTLAALALAFSGAAAAQSSASAPRTACRRPRRSRATPIPARGAKRSEREARDQLGAERATGDQLGPPSGQRPSEEQVRRMLEKQGFSDIQALRAQGDAYVGRATKNGKFVQLRVDPQRGKVEGVGG